ncbi:sugar phosphate isomerase/epimerase family protein [Rhodococcus spongiicola]|uniref:Sugar phosphate isomerase/epimerase n=1 Tax=Rhodococcus spongiicola TaxID=2487352 RepID=A0A3S3AA20_9NOCA|nr:sugar phosphate isomerase/epimerase family protein [Rhodococcus spongiicola]RVW03199.1 sugar phosphate isomerase/epimerase [Rhodococcus spongiicola]
MKLGIFAKTFPGDIDENMAAVAAAGIRAVQYNLSIAGIGTVPEQAPPAVLTRIAGASAKHGVELAAISGTFNITHPDPAVRHAGITRFPVLAAAADELGVSVITLRSGSRHPQDMWQHHPDNSTPEAWEDSRTSLQQLAVIAETTGVKAAFEPEHTNVVSTAELARTMLDEVRSDRLKIVFDAANLLDAADLSARTIGAVIDRALDLLGPDLALAHAKELVVSREQVAPGEGVLPWQHIIDKLTVVNYIGAVVMHGLPPSGVPIAVETLAPLIDTETGAPPNNRSV